MRTKNSLIILGLILALMTGITSINAFAATITWDAGGDGVSWSDGTNWDTDAVPTSSDDVIIPSSFTVQVNTAVDIGDLTVNGTLEPDASTSRTIRIRKNLIVGTGGQVNYTDVSGGSTGRLSWTFEGEDGTNSITNNKSGTAAVKAASLQFYDVTINGTIELTASSADLGNCTFYGDLTVNGSLTPSATNDISTYFDKAPTDASTTVQNNGTLTLDNVVVSADGNVNTTTDINLYGDLTVDSGGELEFQTPATVTKTGVGTITNNGTLSFNSGSSLSINASANTTIARTISNFDGDISVSASAKLSITATYDIQGAGSITTASSSTLSLNDGDGVAGALGLGSYAIDSGTDIELLGGITGFSGASVSSIANLWIGATTGSAAVTTNESFSMSGDLFVNSTAGTNSLTASAGTITMSGASKSLTTGGESVSLYGLSVTGTVDAGWGQSLTLTNHLSTGASGTFAVQPGANTAIWFTGSGMDIVQGAANSIFVVGDGAGGNHPALNITGDLELGSDLQLGTGSAAGGSTYTLTVQNGGELNFSSFTFTPSPNGTFSTESGALLTTANALGFNGSFDVTTATPNSASITLNTGTDLRYETGALQLGLASVSFTENTENNITTIDDITIDGAEIVGNLLDGSSTLTLTGNLTLESGKFAPTGDVLAMSGSSKQIVNNGNSASMSINSLYVSGDITTTADLAITGASATVIEVENGASFVASASSSISMTGATSGTIAGPGTLTFYDLGIYNGSNGGTDLDGTASFTIANDFTVGNSSTFFGFGNSEVTFNGANSDLTIDGTASSATFASLVVDAAGNLSTSNSFAAGAQDNIITIAGSLSQSANTFYKYGTGSVASTGNSTTFFVIDLVDANSHNFTGDLDVIKQIGGSGTFVGNNGDDLTFYGDQEDADALTDDERFEAWIDVAAEFGNVLVPATTELQLSNAYTSATVNSGTITVNGRLESSTTINLGAANTDGAIIFNSGSEVLTSGSVAGVGGLFYGINITTGNAAKQFDDNVDYFISGSSATLGFDDITGATGDGVTSTSITAINNLTTNSTGAIVLSESFTFTGDFDNDGGANYGSAVSGTVTAGGANSTIASSNSGGTIDFWALNIDAAATNATASATIGIRSTGAHGFTVEDGGSFESSASFTIHDDDGGTADNIFNGNSTASDLTFFDLFLAPTATNVNFDSDFIISGSATVSNLATIEGGTNSTLEFTGSSRTITVFASDAFIANNLTINGLIYTSSGLNTPIVVKDDFNVTSSGQFDMTNGSLSFTGSTTQTIVNEGTLDLHDLHVAQGAGNFVYTDDSFSIDGGILVEASSGSFIADGISNITIGGSATITNLNANDPGTLQLQNLTVNASASYYDDIMLKGNLVIGSAGSLTFDGAAGSSYQIVMDSTGTKSISNDGTLVFDDLIIADATNNVVTTADGFTVSGSFTVGGTTNDGESFTASSGVITLGTSSTISNNTGTAADVTLYSLTVPTGASAWLENNDEVYLDDDLTVEGNGVFEGGTSSKLWFTGDAQQNLTLGATAVYRPYDATLNNESGLVLNSSTGDINVNQFDVQNTLRLQRGDIDLNGDNIITIDVESGQPAPKLDETAGNTVINNGVSAAVGHVYATNSSPGALTNADFGGLGMVFTMDDPGTLTVRRYHIPRSIGGDDQAARYYSVAATNSSLDAKIVFKYDESEIGLLNEDDFLLMYADDPSNGPWVKETTATVNTSLNRLTTDVDEIQAFTGATEWWTIGSPSVLTATTSIKGLADNPLASGTDDNAIFGLTFSANGEIELSTVRFNLGRNLGVSNEARSFTVYYSEDDDFSTTEDNIQLITGYTGNPTSLTGGASGDSFVQFDVSAQADDYTVVEEGINVNYFLTMHTADDLSTATATITPQITQNQVTVSGGIIEPFSITGDAYSFLPSIEVEPNENGLDEGPLVAGQTDNAIFGFKAEVTSITGLPGFNGFTLNFDADPSAVFNNVKLFRSVDSDFRTTGDNTEIALTTKTIGTSSIIFAFSDISLDVDPRYFFVTADVKSTVDESVSSITPTLNYNTITSITAGVRGTDGDGNEVDSHQGYTYEFKKGTITIDNTNNMSASNLGIGAADQPVYGFTVTPDNSQDITLNSVVLDVTLSVPADSLSITNWKLINDVNDNGYFDASETSVSASSVFLSNDKNNVTFSGINQSFNTARNYIVVARVKSTATDASTLSINIPDERYVTVSSPNTVNAGGPFPTTAVAHTMRSTGTPSDLEIVTLRDSSVTSGATLPITVRSVDSNGYPTPTTSAETVSIAKVSGTGTVGGTSAGIIASGKYYITIEPTFTATNGSSDLLVNATGSSLNASGNSNSITILEADPAANDGNVVISQITTTTARISQINAASTSGDGRVVVIRQGRHPEPPTDGETYSTTLDLSVADDDYQTGPGSIVVYDGIADGATTLDLSGLLPGTRYYVAVFEYNGTGSRRNYASASAFTNDDVQNPVQFTTTTGDFTGITTAATAANIQTDIDVSSKITSASDVDYFQFRMPNGKSNAVIRISDLPANYNIEIYDASAGVATMTLLRNSGVTSTTDEVIVINNLSSGPYIIKVFGATSDDFDSSNSYTIRVSTSSDEIYTQDQ